MGGGAAAVEGYNNRMMRGELEKEFGARLRFVRNPTGEEIRSAHVVLCNVGTRDNEGWDRPFALPEEQEKRVEECVNNNPHTVVIVTSGSGIRMTGWNDKARAIVYAWYGGQIGNTALAEILSGKTNPSGKLPMTIEREFTDSPASGYIPAGETLYTHWSGKEENAHPVYDVRYKEGVFVGYRWYEKRNIEPLYPFGHGLSYTTFAYDSLKVSPEEFSRGDVVTVSFAVRNTCSVQGAETAQLYVEDVVSSVPRPVKELKGFVKVELAPGESRKVELHLDKDAFSFWDAGSKSWVAEKGKYILHVGSSSKDIRLRKEIELR